MIVVDRADGRLAGECLIARGCKRLAFFGEVRVRELEQRFLGLQDAAREAGLAEPLQLDTHFAADVMPAEIAAHIDTHANQFDGVFAASDVIAMRTMRALADRRIAVPAAMAVVGFDDLPFAEQTVPRITTIRQDLAQGARLMTQALFDRIAGSDAASTEMEPALVRRDTA